MTDKIVETEFEQFMIVIGLKDAPEIQRKLMRTAFFAGTVSLFNLMGSFNGTADEELSADELAVIESVDKEINAFITETKCEASK